MKDTRILFLGVAGDSYVAGKQILSTGGIVIKLGDMQFHIDPGPGALIKSKQYDIHPRENTAVFLTSNNIIHSNDINAIISAMTLDGEDKRGVLVTSKLVMDSNDCLIQEKYKKCVEKSLVLEVGAKVGVGDVYIIATPTKNNEGTGFKFLTQNFVLGVVADTEYGKEVIDAHTGCDIIILNVSSPQGQKIKGQMNTDDAINFLKKTQPTLAIITHFGSKMLSADPINEARTIQRESKIQVVAAKDGMIINPYSYSALIKQRSLKSF